MRLRFIICILLGLLWAADSSAQVLPKAGTHFTFGIPEGPDGLVDPSLGTEISSLTLNIVSIYDGRGVLSSPSGYCKEFTFSANKATVINLPYSLMHLNDIGKTNKGITIRTSQPANAVFHDFLLEAGEATQIYPDEALDTDYRISSWGVYNDPGENNHSEFIVTATQDSTDVTITPSVKALGNHAAGAPIQIMLNRGECYMVKADLSGTPVSSSLSNSIVHSTKLVSVLAGVTCGYVPLGVESCNQILDEILPRKITGSTFYITPLHDGLVENTVLFTSDVPSFSLLTSSGIFYSTTNGRLIVTVSKPTMFNVTELCQCFLLAEGSTLQPIGDPSIVSILPYEQCSDTMIWYTPPFIGQVRAQDSPFENYVSVTYPQASEAQVLLDGVPIASVSTPQGILGSQMSAAIARLQPGVHLLTSPVPILATVSGFSEADGYSFMPGGIGPKIPEDTILVPMNISATQAKTCRTFQVPISSKFNKSDAITSVVLTATYDPSILNVISVNFGPAAQGGQWTTDIRTPGTIIVTGACLQPFTDSGAIAFVTFGAGSSVVTTPISATMEMVGGDKVFRILDGNTKENINIQEARDTMKASFAVDGGRSVFGNIDTATVRVISAPNEAIDSLDLFVTYRHDLMNLLYADMNNTLIPGITTIKPVKIDQLTDEIQIKFLSPIVFSGPGVVARLVFETYVSDSTSGKIGVRTSLPNSRPCPLDILSDTVSGEFFGSDTCGYSDLRTLLRNQPFTINSIIPNPSNGSFTIDINRHLFGGDPLHISLTDVLGNEVWSTDHLSADIHQQIFCTLQSAVPNGTYLIRVAGSGRIETRKIVIRN